MKYTLEHIRDKRFDPNRSQARKISERYVIINAIGKAFSQYPTWLLLNLGVHPDTVTFAGIVGILASAGLFIGGHPDLAVIALLFFFVTDTVDGDMARVKGPTLYGGNLDSFGADFFYGIIPFSISYYLVASGYASLTTMLAGAGVSTVFLLTRLTKAKMVSFSEYIRYKRQSTEQVGDAVREQFNSGLLHRLVHLYRHEIIRGNFFAEAGMIGWFSVLTLFNRFEWLIVYFWALFAYNVGYLALNFFSTYVYFLQVERSKQS